MKRICAVLIMVVLVSACASTVENKDPYPGSGGLILGTPSSKDIKSGRAVFDLSKFAPFKIGVTTKNEVVKHLGKPAWWRTEGGSSLIGYDYVRKESVMGMRKVERAIFTFDLNFVLAKIAYPGSETIIARDAISPVEYKAKMEAYINAARNNDGEKLIELTSPLTRQLQGDAALKLLHKNDTIPLFSKFKVSKYKSPQYTEDEMGNAGFTFTMLLTNKKGMSAPLFIGVLKENGVIYVSSYGIAK